MAITRETIIVDTEMTDTCEVELVVLDAVITLTPQEAIELGQELQALGSMAQVEAETTDRIIREARDQPESPWEV